MRTIRTFISVCLVFILLVGTVVLPVQAQEITGAVIGGSSEEPRSFYERMVVLPNGDLLATWQRDFPIVTNWQGMKSFYFYKSSDQGKTWSYVSELDPSNYTGLSRNKMGMPGLFVFPQQLGEYSAGTVIFATSDWDTTNGYCVHVWRSSDNGQSWVHHSNLAARGLDITSGTASVWEPEFVVGPNNELICYYSDERQPGYDQCLAFEVSYDGGVTWGEYTIVAGEYDADWQRGVDPSLWRPGMPRVLRLKDGTYFMAHENIAAGHNGIITCRTSTDGRNWGSSTAVGTPVSTSGASAFQCPEIAYIDDGSTYGRLFLRGMNDTCSASECFTSTDKGATWQLIEAPLTLVHREAVGSSWSGTMVTIGNKLIELNNYYNGSYNEIHCGSGVLSGNQLIVDGANYRLRNVGSNLCLDDAGGSLDWGNEMILWSQNNLETQSWNAQNIGDGFAFICNYSDLALDNPNSSQTVGTRIVQWDKNYSTAQQWKMIPAGSGLFRIQNVSSGLYLDTENGSTAEHANIIQNAYSDSDTQKWKLERLYDEFRLQSYNISDCFVFHESSNRTLIAPRDTSMQFDASQWRIVPGIADSSCVSIESVDMPGYYVRHYEGNVILSQNDGSDIFKQDATWRMTTGLASGNATSFESYNITGAYLRHYNSYLCISQISNDIERADATFYVRWQ